MKLQFRIIVFLGILFPSVVFGFFKDRTNELLAVCEAFEEKYGIKIYYDHIPSDMKGFEVEYAPKRHFKTLIEIIETIDVEYSKYPRNFIQKSDTQAIVLLKKIVGRLKQKSTGLALNTNNYIVLDYTGAKR